MSDLPPQVGDGADDAQLLARARAGDSDAFADLYTREVEPARRLARILVGGEKAEELVAESFARVLAQIKAGRGPTDDFRAYLQVTIRNGYRDGLRAIQESPSSDQPWLLDDVLPPVEELVEDLDREVAITALATLPKSWQQVLWHLEVEGRKPAEVAGILEMDAGAVSSLAYRAREGLKRAYLDQHLRPAGAGDCGWTQARLSQYVRGDLSPRAEQKVAAHIDDCAQCALAYATVDRVNQKLAAWLFPVVLWGMVGAEKGGLLWIAGASGVGGTGATGTPASNPSGTAGGAGPNPVVLGVAATIAAAGLVAGLAFGLMAATDKGNPRDAGASVTPSGGTTQAPPTGPTDDPAPPPSDEPSDQASPSPVVAPTDAPTSVLLTTSSPPTTESTDPTTEPTDDPTTEPTDPTTDPTTEPPLVEVVPKAPIERDITACSTLGSLNLARTTGVDYVLTVGDGLEGPWTVVATAQDGYVIAGGAPTVFEGDLGTYHPCVHIASFEAQRNGPALVTPWNLLTTVEIEGSEPTLIRVDYDFAVPVLLISKPSGWTCTGTLVGPLSGPVSCTLDYNGAPPPVVDIAVLAVIPGLDNPPPGTVTVYSNGYQVNATSF